MRALNAIETRIDVWSFILDIMTEYQCELEEVKSFIEKKCHEMLDQETQEWLNVICPKLIDCIK